MKIFSLILLISLVINQISARSSISNLLERAHDITQDSIDIKFRMIIESVRQIIKNGNKEMEISPLDPLSLSAKSGNFSSDIFKGLASVQSVNISGTSDYIVDGANFKIAGLIMNITLRWPILKVNFNSYNINGTFHDMLDFNGTGDAESIIRNLIFTTKFPLKIDVRKQRFSIENMKTNISIEMFEVISITGVEEEDLVDMAKEVLSEQVPQLIEKNQEEIVKFVNDYIMKEFNEILNDITIRNLISNYTSLLYTKKTPANISSNSTVAN